MARKMTGRAYNGETAKEIAKRLAAGEAMSAIAQDPNMPAYATIKKWIKENKYNAFTESQEITDEDITNNNIEKIIATAQKEKQEKATSTGRPSVFTEEIANEILSRVMLGESLRKICEDDHMPHRKTAMLWKANNLHGFGDQYSKAFMCRVEQFAEECLDILDDSRNDFIEKCRQDGSTFIQVDNENITRSNNRANMRFKILERLVDQFNPKMTTDITNSDQSLTPTAITKKVIKTDK